MRWKSGLAVVLLVFAGAAGTFSQDLFEEAGHALGHSRWVNIRLFPAIEIALEADDVVLVQSIDHPAKSFAMKLDGKSVASDCAVTETKDTSYTVASESKGKNKIATGSTSTTTTYWARCEFPGGTSDLAKGAREIVVQVAMTNGTTKPHPLNRKELKKFQALTK